MSSSRNFDVVILGAGFGGSLLASILCKQGLTVCLIDKSSHPRFAVGESSTPAADLVLKSLVETYALDELKPFCQFGSWRETHPEIRCGCKRGFSYFWHGGPDGYTSTGDHQHELLVAASSHRAAADTQWYRADVDQFFCEFAVKCGAALFVDSQIVSIERLKSHPWKIHTLIAERDTRFTCQFLVDATGHSAALLNHLKISEISHQLHTKTSAIFSHFDHVPSINDSLSRLKANQKDDPYVVDDSAIHHLFSDGWLWQLRFENGPTSLGFVTPQHQLEEAISPEDNWGFLKKRHHGIRDVLGNAKRSEFPGKMFQSLKLQRLFASGAGEDWAALPSTIGFIDPLHSTGIAQTLIGIFRLAKLVAMTPYEERTQHLTAYSKATLQEFHHIDKLVAGCYQNLHDFERFKAWTMLYFAAATTFEKEYCNGLNSFLCATDSQFHSMLDQLFHELVLNKNGQPHSFLSNDEFVDRIRTAIAPFNSVGLFSPKVNNMYHYTAATK